MAPWPWAKTKPAHKAVAFGELDKLTKLLRKKRADVNAENSNGVTALHIAAAIDNMAISEELLAHDKINPNAQGPNGKTPLHVAISAYNVDSVNALLEHHLINVNLPDHDGRTPLHYAVDKNDYLPVSMLIHNPGVDYHAQDKRLRTAPSWALHLERPQVTATLISERDFVSEVSLTDADGDTALHKAGNLHSSTLARLVKGQTSAVLEAKNRNSETALQVAARLDRAAAFEQLVIGGADLGIRRESDGAGLLHIAAQHHSHGVAEYMQRLEPALRRALISATDQDGNTPLHLAAESGDIALMGRVLELCVLTDELPLRPDPVEVTRVNGKGYAAVELAAFHDHVETTMRLLLAEGTAPEELLSRRRKALARILPRVLDDGHNRTAELLGWAVRGDVLDHFKSLRQQADEAMLENFMVLAAGAGHLQVVRYLVEEGVDPNTHVDGFGTPLGVATAYGRVDVMRFLLNLKSVDASRGVHDGDTPLMTAIRSRSTTVMSTLINDELLQSFTLDLNTGLFDDKEARSSHSNPLLLISELGYHDMAELLLRRDYVERGWLILDISDDLNTQTPLSIACKLGHWRVAELLLQAYPWTRGVDMAGVDASDADGRTPFSYACASPSPETIALFLKSGLIQRKLVDPNHADNSGVTPLAHACQAGRVDNVKLLFDSGMLESRVLEPDIRDRTGRTPLAHACLQGAWKIVQLFLDHCLLPVGETDLVDFRTLDMGYRTLFDLAARSPSAMKTVLVLLDDRLIKKGLIDPREAYLRMRTQIAHHSSIEWDYPDMGQLVQRFEELECVGADGSELVTNEAYLIYRASRFTRWRM